LTRPSPNPIALVAVTTTSCKENELFPQLFRTTDGTPDKTRIPLLVGKSAKVEDDAPILSK